VDLICKCLNHLHMHLVEGMRMEGKWGSLSPFTNDSNRPISFDERGGGLYGLSSRSVMSRKKMNAK